MTYRNNLDAAVARGDALQQEVKRLAAENASLRAKPKATPRRSTHVKAIGAIAALGLAAVGGVVGLSAVGDSEAVAAPEPGPPEVATAVDELGTCADLIAAAPTDMPRDAEHLAALERTGAQCRQLLRKAASNDAAIGRWADAEDVLGNRISLISVYVASGPAALDGGKSADQLWREYRGALRVRDAALSTWRSENRLSARRER